MKMKVIVKSIVKESVFFLIATTVTLWGCVHSDPDQELPLQVEELEGGNRNSNPLSDSDTTSLSPEQIPPSQLSIATYNVYNLFDHVDDAHNEGEYTPNMQWTFTRYQERLAEVARVIVDLNVDVLALQEVESTRVLADLAQEVLNQGGPEYIDQAVSPTRDPRGISLAVLSRFPLRQAIGRPINSEYTCQNGTRLDGSRPEARPLYQVDLWGNEDQAALSLLITHWKSRASDDFPCRVTEHQERSGIHLNSIVRELTAESDRAIIVLGDFNADETERSMTVSLDATLNQSQLSMKSQLWNTWSALNVSATTINTQENSTYFFDGRWHRLDHILINKGVALGEGRWNFVGFELFNASYLISRGRPNIWNTNRASGYSDHLPLRAFFTYQQ